MNSIGSVLYRVSLALGLIIFLFSAVGVQAEELQQGTHIFLPSIVGGNATGSQEVDESIDHTYLVSQEEIETDEDQPAGHPHDVVYQDEHAARGTDIALFAEKSGLSMTQAEETMAFQDAFGQYADDLIARYPNQISAMWIDQVSSQSGHIQFIGSVPAELTAAVAQANQSNSALEGIVLSGDGVFTLDEHAMRTELAAEALTAQGYDNMVTFYDPAAQVTRVEIKLPLEAAEPSKAQVANVVQNHLVAARALNGEAASAAASVPLDLELTVIRGDGPIVTDEHTYGGTLMRDDGVSECTGGWTARNNANGTLGILTAGHCDGINQHVQPGCCTYAAPFIKQIHGTAGDAEFHTTPSHAVYDDFYADATNLRDVTSIRSTSSMVGSSICVYGRFSNRRTCGHRVEAINVCVTFSNVRVCNLARTASTTTIGGDSGGGWGFDNTAWGVHKGTGSGKGYFTPVQAVESGLGVTILR